MTGPAECTVFFLPGLGLDASALIPVAQELDARLRAIAIELPGHGDAPDAPDGSVSAQVDAAVEAIAAHADGGPWLLCAHSMGGKVAAGIAARVRDGSAPLFGLLGVVLLAPSPPTPEPMPESKRHQMLTWIEHGHIDEVDARTFVDDNVGAPLPRELQEAVVASVRAMSPSAWRRWLEIGSVEDLSHEVGVLDLPCLVLGGDHDDALGATAQPELLAGVYPRARFVTLPGAGHLLPFERPAEVGRALGDLWNEIAAQTPLVPHEWGLVIASPRTTPKARSALSRRALPDHARYTPRALTPAQLELLRSIADRLVPQSSARHIDLAARVDASLAAGGGDGWRPTGALSDEEEYRSGLTALATVWPDSPDDQDDLIRDVIGGTREMGGTVTADKLRRWFEDVRVDVAREWLTHPASLATIGYDGFATGAEEADFAGYRHLGAGVRDEWEPSDLGTVTVPDVAADTTEEDAA